MKTYVHLLLHLAEFFLELEMFQAKVVVKIETNFMSVTFFQKLYRLRDDVVKYSAAE
jgi:hypothetical protein